MVHERSDESERRRLLVRLAVSVNALLLNKLRLPIPSDLGEPLPIRPPEVLRLLRRLAGGQDILIDTCSPSQEENPAVEESETEMSEG